MNDFMAAATLLVAMILFPVAFIITFVAVCSATTALSPNKLDASYQGFALGGVAGAVVVVIIAVAISRFKAR
jgi:hypothetical protein